MRLFVSAPLVVFFCVAVCVATRNSIRISEAKTKLPFLQSSPQQQLAEQIRDIMDFTADPCQDFYQYACGGWLDSYQLPADRSYYSLSSNGIADNNEAILREILEDPSGSWPIIGEMYESCMDEGTIEKMGTIPIDSLLSQLGDVSQDPVTVMKKLGTILHANGVDCLFSSWVMADPENPSITQFNVDQGGMGLYVPADYQDAPTVAAYHSYITQMFVLLGESSSSASAIADQVVAIETELAASSLAPDVRRDPYLLLNPASISELVDMTTSMGGDDGWSAYFRPLYLPAADNTSAWEWAEQQSINVNVPPFLYTVDLIFNRLQDPDQAQALHNYMRWCLLNGLSDLLPIAFRKTAFAFYGTFLSGQEELPPRWRQCVQTTDNQLGYLLGRYFVREAFSQEAKDMNQDLINGIEDAFLDILPDIAWLDDETRALSADKLALVSNLIGFPDKWTDYSSLCLDSATFFLNSMKTRQLAVRNMFKTFYAPTDLSSWEMTPPTVNAYYDPSRNQMVFPAGILQSPFFFDVLYPLSMNFGGIGNVMGHELSHGFDDQGSQYDGTGKLTEWWPESVRDAFDEQAQCVSRLYSNVEVLPGLYINGNLTLGENIADMGGVHLAHVAYQNWVKLNGEEPQLMPELTNEQLHFVTYALTWCEADTDEHLRLQIAGNPHSPAKARTNVPLSQYSGFADAFQCAADTPMNPPASEKCAVW